MTNKLIALALSLNLLFLAGFDQNNDYKIRHEFHVFKQMLKIEIVLQNSHIFLFIISSTIKKNERNKMFLADFNVKKELLTSKSFREKVVFFKNKSQVFFNSATKLNITISL